MVSGKTFWIIGASDGIGRELALARAITGDAARLAILDVTDPDALEQALYGPAPAPMSADPILPLGGRREGQHAQNAQYQFFHVPNSPPVTVS